MQENKFDIICLCNTHGIGGAQLNAGMLAAEFSKRGYRSSLGFLFEREVNSDFGTPDKFILSRNYPRGFFQWLRFFRTCKQEILLRQPKAIIGFQPASNILGAILARLLPDCRMIATQRNPSQKQSFLGRFLDQLIGSTPLYYANIAVSNSVAQSYAGYPTRYLNKIDVVHNATPPLEFIDEDRDACQKYFGMRGPIHVIGCIGRLHSQKNFQFALEVHAKLSDTSHLYIAGTGPDEAYLKNKAAQLGTEERVHFLGSITGKDITRFYRSLDILLFPSIYEGFGRVLVEAMSQGVPVISSDIEIAREVAAEAAVYCPFDPIEWVPPIESILNNNITRDHYIQAGIQRSESFSIKLMVDEYLKRCNVGHS